MKKIITLMAFVTLLLCSCGKEHIVGEESGLAGTTWTYKEGGNQLTLSFKKDGTGTWTEKYYDSYYGTETDRGTFTWEMEGKTEGSIYIKNGDSYSGYYTTTLFFEIEGKKMYLYELYENDKDFMCELTKQ